MSRVLVVLPHIHATRLFYLTNILPKLSESNEVVVASPIDGKGIFRDFCESTGSKFIRIPKEYQSQPSSVFFLKLQYLCEYFGNYYLGHRKGVKTVKDNLTKNYKENPSRFRKLNILAFLLAFPIIINVFRWFLNHYLKNPEIKQWVDNTEVDTIIVYDLYNLLNDPIIINSSHINCRVGEVRSWDNITCKGYLRVRFDYYLVWNQDMVKELLDYYDISSRRIKTVGYAMADYILEMKSVDVAKNSISFFLAYPDLFPDLFDHIKDVQEAFDSTPENQDNKLVIRVQPGRWSDMVIAKIDTNGKFDLNRSIEGLQLEDAKVWQREYDAFLELVKKSKYIINYPSTTIIDAALLDTVCLTMSYDSTEKPYWKSNKRYMSRNHYQWILETSSNFTIKSKRELNDCVKLLSKTSVSKKKEMNSLCNRFYFDPIKGFNSSAEKLTWIINNLEEEN